VAMDVDHEVFLREHSLLHNTIRTHSTRKERRVSCPVP
jgi:hypothetical protein